MDMHILFQIKLVGNITTVLSVKSCQQGVVLIAEIQKNLANLKATIKEITIHYLVNTIFCRYLLSLSENDHKSHPCCI